MPATLAQAREILEDARASGPALRTFEKIAERWKLKAKDRQTLLGLPKSTYFSYLQKPGDARLSHDTLERISYILGIYRALQILLPRREAADEWIRRKNGAASFNGYAPLDIMLGGKVANLYLVRAYLDGERGW